MPTTESPSDFADAQPSSPPIALPPADLSLPQDEEWCVAMIDGQWQQIRFHDYSRLYQVPGLYEYLIYDTLQCNSPATLKEILHEQLQATGGDPGQLRVLDLGAGNGMMGEELHKIGVTDIVGVDIIPAAAEATERDRPGLYRDYHVVDLTDLSDEQQQKLQRDRFNCMTCVAALGFGDIPTAAFVSAFNLVTDGGWVMFNLKEDFLDTVDDSGFAGLVQRIMADKTLNIQQQKRYRHRLGTDRTPLYYVALIGRKTRNIEM